MILIIAGTRPEELKTCKLVELLKKNNIPTYYVFTGQHTNLINKYLYDYEFIINNNDLNRLDNILSQNINNFSCFFKKHSEIKYVIVQGDTTSALAVAISAFHNNVKVIHLEAGLRSFDKKNPYPEEVNRKLISQIADIHLCPTINSFNNLQKEKTDGQIYVVGNTSIDNLLSYKDKCEYTNKILITLHRRENHNIINKWFEEINNLAIEYPEYEFILPIHPNPNVIKYKDLLTNINVINPLSHEELLNILIKTRLVITDSGGLQEECSFFNKKCLVCRETTERPEAINISSYLIEKPEFLTKIFKKHINDYNIDYICPFGDGHSSEKILHIIKNVINKNLHRQE